MYQDWLKIHRKIVRSAVFADAELFKLWVLCLVKANWKDCTVFWEGLKTPIHLERGQFVTGRQALHAEYYGNRRVQRKSPRTVWRWLHTLQSLHNIRLDSVQAFTVVTIVNYDTYQDSPADDVQPDVQAVSNACPTRVQPIGSGVSTEEEGLDSDKNRKEPEEGQEEVDTIQDVRDAWNATAGTVSIRKLTPKRLAAGRTRLAEKDWDWREALAKFPLPCFGDGKWTPTWDWFMRPDKVTEILDGNYDWSKDNGKPTTERKARIGLND